MRDLLRVSNQAADWFSGTNGEGKRTILKLAGSNLTLTGKILSIQAAKPFVEVAKMNTCPSLLGDRDDVRTRKGMRALIERIAVPLMTEEAVGLLREVRARLGGNAG